MRQIWPRLLLFVLDIIADLGHFTTGVWHGSPSCGPHLIKRATVTTTRGDTVALPGLNGVECPTTSTHTPPKSAGSSGITEMLKAPACYPDNTLLRHRRRGLGLSGLRIRETEMTYQIGWIVKVWLYHGENSRNDSRSGNSDDVVR
jgi:hypothetical protein